MDNCETHVHKNYVNFILTYIMYGLSIVHIGQYIGDTKIRAVIVRGGHIFFVEI